MKARIDLLSGHSIEVPIGSETPETAKEQFLKALRETKTITVENSQGTYIINPHAVVAIFFPKE